MMDGMLKQYVVRRRGEPSRHRSDGLLPGQRDVAVDHRPDVSGQRRIHPLAVALAPGCLWAPGTIRDTWRLSTTSSPRSRRTTTSPTRGWRPSIFLAMPLQRPLLLEGEAGVGKTEVAKVLAALDRRRAGAAAVLRGHRRRAGRLRVGLLAPAPAPPRRRGERRATVVEDELYSRAVPRAAGRCCAIARRRRRRAAPPVLLVDEVDRADDEFEAFLLEILSDCSITVPELGAFRAEVPPIVVLTSNRTRDVHDALKRRCLYHWIAHPDFERELAIVRRARARGARGARRVRSPPRSRRCAGSSSTSRPVSRRRSTGRRRSPRSARARLDERAVDVTLGTILKYREDQERVRAHGLARARRRGGLERGA